MPCGQQDRNLFEKGPCERHSEARTYIQAFCLARGCTRTDGRHAGRPVITHPLEAAQFEPEDMPRFLKDNAIRGAMTDLFYETLGVESAQFSLGGPNFLDSHGYFFDNVFGDLSTTGSGLANPATANSAITIGATACTLAAAPPSQFRRRDHPDRHRLHRRGRRRRVHHRLLRRELRDLLRWRGVPAAVLPPDRAVRDVRHPVHAPLRRPELADRLRGRVRGPAAHHHAD